MKTFLQKIETQKHYFESKRQKSLEKSVYYLKYRSNKTYHWT